MNLRLYAFTVGLLSVSMATPPPFASLHAYAEEDQAGDERIAEGDWGGPVGDGFITFRFQYENGSWLGWFVSGKDGKLYPVEELRVAGRSVSFTHKSKPELAFSLSVAEDDMTLSGTATRPSGMATFYSLTRKSRE